MQEVFKLSEVAKYVQQVIDINFDDEIWIACEIHQVNESHGHFYIKLVEKHDNSDEITATLEARIWRKQAAWIRNKTKTEVAELFSAGLEAKIKGQLKFHQVFGLAFHIKDIDPDYALGAMERKRRLAHERLSKDGIYQLNKAIPTPDRWHRIAVISSRTAAGWMDFKAQLINHPYGIPYHIDLYHCPVQGQRAVEHIISALQVIDQSEEAYDIVGILRGGGSKLDLHIFDDEKLCRAIGAMQRPVFTAIGHEIDQSLADITAHTSFITPTAMGQAIQEHMIELLSHLQMARERLYDMGMRRLEYHRGRLSSEYLRLEEHSLQRLQRLQSQRDEAAHQLEVRALRKIQDFIYQYELMAKSLSAVDPLRILKQGYTVIHQDDRMIKDSASLDPDRPIDITFHDKKVHKT